MTKTNEALTTTEAVLLTIVMNLTNGQGSVDVRAKSTVLMVSDDVQVTLRLREDNVSGTVLDLSRAGFVVGPAESLDLDVYDQTLPLQAQYVPVADGNKTFVLTGEASAAALANCNNIKLSGLYLRR